MKKVLVILTGMILLLSVLVTAGMLIPASDKAKEKVKASFVLPAHAVEVAPGVFYLGKAIDKGRVVEGYAMFVKPGTVCGDGVCDPGENVNKCPADCAGGEDPEEPDASSCYTFLAKGAKWKTVETYIVNTTNTRGLNSTFITSNLATNIDKWEDAVEENFEILGDEVTGDVDGADTVSPDNKNEVYFADVEYQGAIAVAIIWGIFGGPPPFRELVEWDMIFDDVDFDWGVCEEGVNCTKKMDFENIATHELGHAVGLGDLYNTECSEQTMYGYAGYGETKKRDLNDGDIAGIKSLY